MAVDSVPDTSPVYLSVVLQAVGLSAGASLADAHDAAIPSGFDPTYAQTGESLYEFRNYQHVASSTVFMETTGSSSYGCGWTGEGGTGTTRYLSGTGQTPSNGDTLYTDAGLTTVFNGGNLKYAYVSASTEYNFIVSAAGVISGYELCSYNPVKSVDVSAPQIFPSCLATLNQTLYHTGANDYPVAGDVLYTNSGATTPYNGLGDSHRIETGASTTGTATVSTVGVIGTITAC